MKIRKREIMFYIALYLQMIRVIINCTVLIDLSSTLQNVMMFSTIVLLIIKILWSGLTIKEAIIKCSIAIILFINYRLCLESGILIGYFFIIATKDMNINSIIKAIAIPMTIFMIFIIMLYFINYFFDIDSLNVKLRKTQETTTVRHTFFYTHPNVFGEHFCWLIFMWMYLKYNKIGYMTYISVIAGAIFLFIFPNSRTNALILILSLFIYFVYNKFDNNLIKFVQRNSYNICFILSFVLMILYNYNFPLAIQLNELLSTRIFLGAIAQQFFGVSLLGQVIPIGGKIEITQYEWIMYYSLDNLYYRLVYGYGIITTILYAILYNKMEKGLAKKNMKKELMFTTILSIFGISEIVGVNIILAFPLLFINKIYEKEENKNESIYNYTNI